MSRRRYEDPPELTSEDREEIWRLVEGLSEASIPFLIRLNRELVTMIRGRINLEDAEKIRTFREGDKVKFIGSGKKLLYRGAQGTIVTVGRGKLRVDFGPPIGIWKIPPRALEVVK